MKEVEPDSKWLDTPGIPEKETTDPEISVDEYEREVQKAQLVMLMRIYDVQMALLTKMDPENANKIFDSHDTGELFNPQLFIPED